MTNMTRRAYHFLSFSSVPRRSSRTILFLSLYFAFSFHYDNGQAAAGSIVAGRRCLAE